MRILGIIFAVFVTLFVVLFIGLQFIDWNKYKSQIIEVVEKETGYEVDIQGDLKVALFPFPHVRVQNLSLANPEESEAFFQTTRVEVYAQFLPLLSGEIAIDSVYMDDPIITLRQLSDGTPNWQPPAFANRPSQDSGQTPSATTNAMPSELRVNNLNISNGNLSYYGEDGSAPLQISEIDVDLSLQSLYGPFDIESSFKYGDIPVSMDIKANRINLESKAIPVQMTADLYNSLATMKFTGVVGYGETPDAQGETEVNISNLQGLLNKFAKDTEDKSGEFSYPVTLSGILSAGMEKASYTNFVLNLGDTRFSGRVDIGNLSVYPEEPLLAVFDLKEGSASSLKGGVKISPENVKVENTQLSYASSDARIDALYTYGKTNPAIRVNITSSQLHLDEIMRRFGMETQKKSQEKFDPDEIRGQIAQLNIPFDVELKADVKTAIYKNTRIQNLASDIALVNNRLDVKKLSVSNYGGADLALSGTIGQLSNLDDIHLKVSAKTSDLETTMQKLEQQDMLKSVPFKVGAFDTNATFTGNLSALKFNARANALDAAMMAAGNISQVLSDPAFDGLSFGLKHPNFANLLTVINKGAKAGPALAKPVDISARAALQDKVYTLSDIQGKLGSITVAGNVKADLSKSVPAISGTLKAGAIPLDMFITTTGPASGGSDARWSRDAIDFSWTGAAILDLDIAAQSITYDKWAFTDAKFSLDMANNTLSIPDWNAGFFGGKSTAAVKIAASPAAGQPAKVNVDLGLEQVGLQPLITALTGTPLIQSQGKTDFQTSLETSGVSIAAFVYGLNGNGSVDGDDITIKGIDVADLSRAASSTDSLGRQAEALFKTGIRGGSSEFDKLTGKFTVREGVVNFNPLLLQGQDADVNTTGNVSLPAWTIDMRSAIQLHVLEGAEVPPPIEISYRGSLSNPGTSFAQEAIQNYLNQKIQSKVQDLIQDKLDDKLGGALGGLLGGQRQQQQAPANDNTQGGETSTEQPSTQQRQPTQQQQIEGLIKGLIR
jgi:uncharacterized protein involved in outer membrane biogenesis